MNGSIDTRLIAFYLPQFHPIPENSRWWGPGFTEWTNVVRAKPLFPGHHQPRLPRDLGFYDLRLRETREAQARLAREYGIHGFCYYTYWLKNGTRLLEGPMEALLAEGTPDFPFCVCWANESWTRRWDGGAADTLIEQAHDDANNAAFFEGMVPFFRDPRYIRIDGRPLLLIYRATLFPDIAATFAQWRGLAQRHGLAAPYMVAVEFFDVNPEVMIARGFDAVCEFPPIMSGADQSAIEVAAHGVSADFRGRLLDYERLAASFEQRPVPAYRRFKGVTLAWDNTARRGTQATACVNFSVDRYRKWLVNAIAQTESVAPAGERLVFINAWNEWAEGTYLEPDQQHGLAYLEATRSALLDPAGADAPAAAGAPAGAALRELPEAARVDGDDAGATIAPAPPASSLRLVGITCVGNEADIIEAFVRHTAALLDHLIILEHNTLDRTREILDLLVAEGLPITVEHSAEHRFFQLAFTNRLLRSALETQGADWVFPLDSDEFLAVATRADLDAALLRAGDAHVRLKWINYVPSPGDDATEPHPLRRIRHCYDYATPSVDDNPWVWKIAINARFLGDYYLDRYEICQGNHFLSLPGQQRVINAPMLPLEEVSLAHFPVRSREQVELKTALALLGRLGTVVERSAHIARIWDEITSGSIGFPALAQAARHYLDTGRQTAEALQDTPMKFAPFPVRAPLAYTSQGLPAIAVILKWIELNMLDDEQRRFSSLRPAGTTS
jgi:Glycosyltransferase WbsX/Glycosyl transferase family 2